MGQIIYREHIVFRGSNISCSLVTCTLPLSLRVSRAGIKAAFKAFAKSVLICSALIR